MQLDRWINRHASVINAMSVLLMAGAVVAIFWRLPLLETYELVRYTLDAFGVLAPVVLVVVYVIATVLLLPATVFSFASGMLFGLWSGTLIAWIGQTLGAAAAFIVSRHFVRARVQRWVARNPKLIAIDHAIAQAGWKIVALLRLSPIMPFNLQNYFYGMTAIRFWPCMIATFVCNLPGTFITVYVGYLAHEGVETVIGTAGKPTTLMWFVNAGGLIITVIGSIYLTRLANAQIKHHTHETGTLPEPIITVSDDPVEDRGWPWGTTLNVTIALLIVMLAFMAHLRPQWILHVIDLATPAE